MRVILASSSPRRYELLKQIGVKAIVAPSDINEEEYFASSVPLKEKLINLAKAKAYAYKVASDDDIVLAADTVVVLGDEIFPKPLDSDHARQMLKSLSGKEHSVFTALAVLRKGSSFDEARISETIVRFRDLSDEEIEGYVRSKEPFGKAGAYAIQRLAAIFVESIKGSYSNVVGLPLNLVFNFLTNAGYKFF